jgi:hypothetical protein
MLGLHIADEVLLNLRIDVLRACSGPLLVVEVLFIGKTFEV